MSILQYPPFGLRRAPEDRGLLRVSLEQAPQSERVKAKE